MSDNIPFEIQLEIIKRVPDVKSLLRFRAVSKQWKSYIDSSEFIAGYRARKTQPHTLLLRYTDNSNEVKYLSVNNHTFTQQQDLAPNVSAFMKRFNDTVVIGYSRGLLCLYAFNRGILILWNPSIRRSVGIFTGGYYLVFGFAVCPVTNEPTIVKFSKSWKVQIFTLSSKKWTVIHCSRPCDSVRLHSGQVVIGRCIYRVVYDRGNFNYLVVSFDLIAKEFKAINFPDKITNEFPMPPSLFISELRGSLVLFVPNRPKVGVWKMEHDCSFTKLFTFNTERSIVRILGFRKNDELVMETREETEQFGTYDAAVEVYEPWSRNIIKFPIYGLRNSFFISSYKETLLLLDHLDSCVYPQDRSWI